MRQTILFSTALLVACNQVSGENAEDKSGNPRLRPVTEMNSPTFGELRAKGYVIVDFVPTSFDCGKDCIGHAFESVFMGKETKSDNQSLIEFACPGTKQEIDDWKCRSLRETSNNG